MDAFLRVVASLAGASGASPGDIEHSCVSETFFPDKNGPGGKGLSSVGI